MKRALMTLGLALALWSPAFSQDFDELPDNKESKKDVLLEPTGKSTPVPAEVVAAIKSSSSPFRKVVLELKNASQRKNLTITVTDEGRLFYQYSEAKEGVIVSEAILTHDELERVFGVFRKAEVVTLPEGVEDVRGLVGGSLVRVRSYVGNDVYDFSATLGYYKDYTPRVRPLITTLIDLGKAKRPAKTAETTVAPCGKVHPACPKCNSSEKTAHIVYGFTSNSELKGPCGIKAGGTARGFESWYCDTCKNTFEDESDRRVREAIIEKRMRDAKENRGK